MQILIMGICKFLSFYRSRDTRQLLNFWTYVFCKKFLKDFFPVSNLSAQILSQLHYARRTVTYRCHLGIIYRKELGAISLIAP